MLFSSWVFIAGFLPATVLVYRLLPAAWSVQWLVIASLFYYGWWNPAYLSLILISTAANYGLGAAIAASAGRRRAWTTGIGVAGNLAALAYFKYLDFIITTVNGVGHQQFALQHVALPLAISFFTFQQIAYLVDVHRGAVQVRQPWEYGLFVSFFPQLIAGPIVHFKEMIPQFQKLGRGGVTWPNIAIGFAVFTVGLFKKTVIADGLGPYADAVFQFADTGAHPSFAEAWCGALAYTFQLYFDFSGYADMAIGAARMFGIVLPSNFNSPYKATSIIEFWRRWHMTLSRFLRDYLYFSLGGNRHGSLRRYLNLFLTMLLGGLWHGAGWNFVLWGGWHGVIVMLNHAWRSLPRRSGKNAMIAPRWQSLIGWLATLLAVILGWVLFRARTLDGAARLLEVMTLQEGIALPARWLARLGHSGDRLLDIGVLSSALSSHGLIGDWNELLTLLALGAGLCVFAPNTQQIFARFAIVLETIPDKLAMPFRLTPAWGAVTGVAAFLALFHLTTRGHVEFIYRFF